MSCAVGEDVNFKRQFVLADNKDLLPAAWPHNTCDGWQFASHPTLPEIEIREEHTGTLVGFMVGWPVSPEGRVVQEHVVLPTGGSETTLHDELYRYAGSWACMIRVGGEWRMYGDPFHSLPMVYHTDLNVIASSTGLIPGQHRSKHQALVDAWDIPHQDHWYPFGLTPYHECRRLLPNHYLKIDTKQVVRHWPNPATFRPCGRDDIRSTVAENLSKNIRAFAENGEPYLSLTAGRDSRVLLACSRELKDQITCHTIRIPDEGARIDFQVAQYMTSKFGLEHVAQSFQPPDQDDLTQWLSRTGHCAAGRTWRNITTLKQLDASRIRFAGIGGEIGRAYYYGPTGSTHTELSPEEVVERFHLPAIQALHEAAREWLQAVPKGINSFHLLDLLYIEQRIGCWASVTSLGHVDSAYTIFPFCDRQVVQALVSLDEEEKRSEEWMTDIIRATWPALLGIPFDQYVGWARIKKGLRRRLTKDYLKTLPARVYRKVLRIT